MALSPARFDAAAVCNAPPVRRIYAACVVGLAAFLLVLVAMREPFRGYLAEVRIAGPVHEGLDLEAATRWLKQANPRAAVVLRNEAGPPPRNVIQITLLAPRSAEATAHLNDLAARWLYQYLPERLQAQRQALLADWRAAAERARQQEDAARQRLDATRQQHWAELVRKPASTGPAPAAAEPASLQNLINSPSPPAAAPGEAARELEALRLELARLLARLTEEHPQVITLRARLLQLEQQASESSPAANPAAAPQIGPADGSSDMHPATTQTVAGTEHFVSTSADRTGSDTSDGAAAAIDEALQTLNAATYRRQQAEQDLDVRVQALAVAPSPAEWSANQAHVITRVGGTPRTATLALAGLAACLAGVLMFHASRAAVSPPKVLTASQLAGLLEIPVIGHTSPRPVRRAIPSLLTPQAVRLVTHLAEVVVGIAVLACLISIAVEPALAAQVAADPFGTLSEVIGRLSSANA